MSRFQDAKEQAEFLQKLHAETDHTGLQTRIVELETCLAEREREIDRLRAYADHRLQSVRSVIANAQRKQSPQEKSTPVFPEPSASSSSEFTDFSSSSQNGGASPGLPGQRDSLMPGAPIVETFHDNGKVETSREDFPTTRPVPREAPRSTPPSSSVRHAPTPSGFLGVKSEDTKRRSGASPSVLATSSLDFFGGVGTERDTQGGIYRAAGAAEVTASEGIPPTETSRELSDKDSFSEGTKRTGKGALAGRTTWRDSGASSDLDVVADSSSGLEAGGAPSSSSAGPTIASAAKAATAAAAAAAAAARSAFFVGGSFFGMGGGGTTVGGGGGGAGASTSLMDLQRHLQSQREINLQSQREGRDVFSQDSGHPGQSLGPPPQHQNAAWSSTPQALTSSSRPAGGVFRNPVAFHGRGDNPTEVAGAPDNVAGGPGGWEDGGGETFGFEQPAVGAYSEHAERTVTGRGEDSNIKQLSSFGHAGTRASDGAISSAPRTTQTSGCTASTSLSVGQPHLHVSASMPPVSCLSAFKPCGQQERQERRPGGARGSPPATHAQSERAELGMTNAASREERSIDRTGREDVLRTAGVRLPGGGMPLSNPATGGPAEITSRQLNGNAGEGEPYTKNEAYSLDATAGAASKWGDVIDDFDFDSAEDPYSDKRHAAPTSAPKTAEAQGRTRGETVGGFDPALAAGEVKAFPVNRQPWISSANQILPGQPAQSDKAPVGDPPLRGARAPLQQPLPADGAGNPGALHTRGPLQVEEAAPQGPAGVSGGLSQGDRRQVIQHQGRRGGAELAGAKTRAPPEVPAPFQTSCAAYGVPQAEAQRVSEPGTNNRSETLVAEQHQPSSHSPGTATGIGRFSENIHTRFQHGAGTPAKQSSLASASNRSQPQCGSTITGGDASGKRFETQVKEPRRLVIGRPSWGSYAPDEDDSPPPDIDLEGFLNS